MGATSRRELLVAAGAGALAAALPWPIRALAADAGDSPLGVDAGLLNLRPELVSVTDTSVTFWWPTSRPTDTTVRIGPEGGALEEVTVEEGQTTHVATVDGLKPGRRYRYELVSDGRRRAIGLGNPGSFTTLVPPSGDRIARIAVLNDLHIGEHCSGTITTVGSTSIPPCFSTPNYSLRMVNAAIREIRRAKPDLLIANGDLTDRGRPDEMRTALAVLKRARVPFVVTRGNHDRRFDGCGGDGDCMRQQAFPYRKPDDHTLTTTRDVGDKLTVIGLDSCEPSTGEGHLDQAGQLEFLESELKRAAARRRRVLLCFHHPVTPLAIATALPPISFGIEPQHGGQDFMDLVKGHDHIVLALHGHTHRNYLSYVPGYHVPFLEAGAIKEYGGTWTLLDIHTDGVMRTSHRVSEPFCRDWVRTTAQEYEGLYPVYTRGPLAARAFVHRYDAGQDVPATLDGPLGAPSLAG